MNDFISWLNEQLSERGWGYNELARRAGISGAAISHIMTQRKTPGYDVCMGIARALGEQPETVLRRAGLLPSLPPEVDREREVVGLFRRLSEDAREAIMATMRNLLGLPARRQASDPGVAYSTRANEPRTVIEWMAYQIAEGIDELPEEDVRRLFDLMKRLRGDEEASDSAAREQMGADS